MRRVLSGLLVMTMAGVPGLETRAGGKAKAMIPDKNLEAALRGVLFEAKGDLTEAMLNNVFVLEARGKKIADLTGLEKCKNLAQLNVADNQVADLGPLKDLRNIQSLDLSNNKITDVTPLKDITRLAYLELSGNQISDLKPLSGLVNLNALYLTGNKIKDISPLAGLGPSPPTRPRSRLVSLSLGRNQIADISALSKLTQISTLELKDNRIEDLTPLTKHTELSLLMLENNKIRDLAALVSMCKADAAGPRRFAPYLRLYLAGNPLSDAAKTKQLADLRAAGVRLQDWK